MSELTLPEKLRIINRCASPQELADRSLELLGNPMIVFDGNMHVTAITDCDVQEDEFVYLQKNRFPSRDFTKEPGWQNRVRDMLRDDQLHVEKLDSNAHMHKVLKVGGRTLGQMEIIDYFRPFSEEDALVVEVMSRVCGAAMLPDDASLSASGLDRLVEYLLDGNALSEEEILAQACLSGWEPGNALYLCCADAFLQGAEFYGFDSRQLGPGSRTVRYKSNLLLLLPADRALPEPPGELEFGMSRIFGRLSEIRNAYVQARNALDVGRRVEPEVRVHLYDRYLEYMPVWECVRSGTAMDYVMPKLLELAALDRARELGLMYTLDHYIRSGRSVSATAREMHLHRNTVNYRIAKAMEILEISLDDPKAFARLEMSLRILACTDRNRYFPR